MSTIEPFIKCSDITTSLTFYTEVLDFKVLQSPDSDPNSFMSMYAFLARGSGRVHLSSHAGDGVFGNVIYLRVDDIDTLYMKFVANGVNVGKPDTNPAVVIKPVEQSWGTKEFSITDPDGNRLIFGQSLLR